MVSFALLLPFPSRLLYRSASPRPLHFTHPLLLKLAFSMRRTKLAQL